MLSCNLFDAVFHENRIIGCLECIAIFDVDFVLSWSMLAVCCLQLYARFAHKLANFTHDIGRTRVMKHTIAVPTFSGWRDILPIIICNIISAAFN
ncbi:hypothetical protein BGP82_02320 [Pseudomonas putida]|uniref:Uncharacterized protein n=1 Tax=Pseudomonas putida TaxID=303 RepID=A0A2S3XCR9_PSEPU|nr:hypothetical protein BGP82_02320 [Pseudomonas putida]